MWICGDNRKILDELGVSPSRIHDPDLNSTPGSRTYRPQTNTCLEQVLCSALDDVDGQPALGSLLVLREHVVTGLAHRLNDNVEGHHMPPIAPQGHAGGIT